MNLNSTKELIEYIVLAGKEIISKSGNIEDIGVKKQFLTDEDIRIERGIKTIIDMMPGEHQFYSEEEHDEFTEGESVWICDPISGTNRFIEGLPHYAIVVSHLNYGEVDLAIVYDPTDDDLYTADSGAAFVNGNQIEDHSNQKGAIIFAPSYGWGDKEQIEKLREALSKEYQILPTQGSFAFNYCLAARSLVTGVVSLTKDAFPEFAGLFIANKANVRATNIKGEENIGPEDRIFVCGSGENHQKLLEITKTTLGL